MQNGRALKRREEKGVRERRRIKKEEGCKRKSGEMRGRKRVKRARRNGRNRAVKRCVGVGETEEREKMKGKVRGRKRERRKKDGRKSTVGRCVGGKEKEEWKEKSGEEMRIGEREGRGRMEGRVR